MARFEEDGPRDRSVVDDGSDEDTCTVCADVAVVHRTTHTTPMTVNTLLDLTFPPLHTPILLRRVTESLTMDRPPFAAVDPVAWIDAWAPAAAASRR